MTVKRRKAKGQFSSAPPLRSKIERGVGSHYNLYGRPKVSFLSEAGARSSAAMEGWGDAEAYLCPQCGGWHKGHGR
jgi:hypothetical protein